jgi:hypothetical protein
VGEGLSACILGTDTWRRFDAVLGSNTKLLRATRRVEGGVEVNLRAFITKALTPGRTAIFLKRVL